MSDENGNTVRWRHGPENQARILYGADDLLLPLVFVAYFPDVDKKEPTLALHVRVVDGVPMCSGVALEVVEGGNREVRQADMKRVDLEEWLEVAVRMAAIHITAEHPGGVLEGEHSLRPADAAKVHQAFRRARRDTRRAIPDSKLADVAAIYREHPTRPVKAIMEAFSIKERTAGNYIRRAKDAGLLPEVES